MSLSSPAGADRPSSLPFGTNPYQNGLDQLTDGSACGTTEKRIGAPIGSRGFAQRPCQRSSADWSRSFEIGAGPTADIVALPRARRTPWRPGALSLTPGSIAFRQAVARLRELDGRTARASWAPRRRGRGELGSSAGRLGPGSSR